MGGKLVEEDDCNSRKLKSNDSIHQYIHKTVTVKQKLIYHSQLVELLDVFPAWYYRDELKLLPFYQPVYLYLKSACHLYNKKKETYPIVYASESVYILQDLDPTTSSIDYLCTTAGICHTFILSVKVKTID